ncbi:MAG: lysylphosphatidylglycerol synthase domain-containing protein [Acidimicrobiia bacterium]
MTQGAEPDHSSGSWRARAGDLLVRPRDEGPSRRRPGDLVRVAIAAVIVAGFVVYSRDPARLERDLVHAIADLPHDGRSFVILGYQILAVWAIGLLVVGAILVRRWRLARDLVIAGFASWILGRALAFLARDDSLWQAVRKTFDLTDAPRFPTVRLAVVVAMVVVASPYLSRPMRHVGQVLVVAIALDALYIDRAFPTDLLGAVVLGWGVAAAVHYAFATPIGRPTAAVVARALARLHLDVVGVKPTSEQPVGRAIFVASTPPGLLHVTALGRDEADAQLIARAWRFLTRKDAPGTLLWTRRQQVEYEAYIELLAAGAGVRVPGVVFAGNAGAVAVLVERHVDGAPLFEVPVDAVTDPVLDEAWSQLARLHAAHIAHGHFDGHHLLVDGDSITVTGFEWAATGAQFGQAAGDVANLLATTAAVVGTERALAAARRGVDADVLLAAVPMLQPQSISGWTHDALGGRSGLDGRLAELRDATARSLDTEPPELRQLYRVHPRSLLMAVGALAAIAVLFSRVGDPEVFWASVRDANWWFVALALVLGLLTDVAFGITFLGNVPIRIPVWPSIELQSAMSFSNLAVPVAADTAIQVRFLQKQGLDLPSAVATGGVLSSVSEIIVQVGLFFVALWLAPDSIDFGRIDTEQIAWIALIAVFVLLVALAVVISVRKIRHVVLPPVIRATRTVWDAVKTPSRLALLVFGNIIAQCFYAGSLLACLHAFGASVDFWTLLALNIGISTIASLVPIPGGGTAVSSVGLAGMLTAFGVPPAASGAAVLAHQLAVTYIPAVPGWFATHDLIRKGML